MDGIDMGSLSWCLADECIAVMRAMVTAAMQARYLTLRASPQGSPGKLTYSGGAVAIRLRDNPDNTCGAASAATSGIVQASSSSSVQRIFENHA
jgi:hypothetical protein